MNLTEIQINLHRFIQTSEAILAYYFDHTNYHNFRNFSSLNDILNKLIGRAGKIVASHGVTTNWNEIKNSSISTFGDQRDENSLD